MKMTSESISIYRALVVELNTGPIGFHDFAEEITVKHGILVRLMVTDFMRSMASPRMGYQIVSSMDGTTP